MTKLSRRHLFQGAAAAGLAATATAAKADGHDKDADVSVPKNGRAYDRVPLRKDIVTVGAVQSRVRRVDGRNPRRGIRDNMEHMKDLIDAAFLFSQPKDLLCFHEFPIQGWYPWDREEALRVAIEIPGPETEEISKKAREHNCYIKFGAYAVDDDWPDHLLSITSIIDPNGDIIARDWKARNIKGVFPGVELFTTTIYSVLDQYIEMYGADAVIPIVRTDIGNLTTSSVQREPELFRAMAMKGAEMFLRTASGGFSLADIEMCSAYNGVPSVIVNNAYSPENDGFYDDAGGGAGGSTIFGARGEVLAEAGSKFEQCVTASINMAAYRKRHKIPDVHMDLYRPIFDKYEPRFAPNLFTEYKPTDLEDSKEYLKDKDRWRG